MSRTIYAVVGDCAILVGDDGFLALTREYKRAKDKVVKMRKAYPEEEYVVMKVESISIGEGAGIGYAIVGEDGIMTMPNGWLAVTRRKEIALEARELGHIVTSVKNIEMYL